MSRDSIIHMKRAVISLIFLLFSVVFGQDPSQARGYWIDPSTGLMWAGKDNGKNVNWRKAVKYCRDLRLAEYSDWRLATIDELQGIYDYSAKAPGLAGKHKMKRSPFM